MKHGSLCQAAKCVNGRLTVTSMSSECDS